jgi:hypothetical protein
MKSGQEMSNVKITNLKESLSSSTLTFKDMWYKMTGSFPCVPCLTIRLIDKQAPNLLNLLHQPSSMTNYVNNEGLYKELKIHVIDELNKNPYAFS